jgi:hypothetical protein
MPITRGSTPFAARLLAAVLLGGSSLLLIAAVSSASAPVYSVATVQAALIRSPGAWIGHIVRVRAVAHDPCVTRMRGANSTCISWRPALLDPSASGAKAALPLRGASRPPLLAALGRLPLVSPRVPAPQAIRWGALATYLVRLRAAPPTVCGTPRCYEALLLDAAPGSL